jgi:hypothetical protein
MARGPFDGMAVRADGFDGGLSLNLNCVGSLCPAVAQATMTSFPIIQNVTFSTPIAVTLRGLGTGRVTLDAAVMGMSSGLAFSLSLRGQAPEPLEAGLLGLGLLALCASAAVRLRRA